MSLRIYSKILICLFFFFMSFQASALTLHSPAFENNGYIPAKFTCVGNNSLPPLFWNKIPANTQSFAITITDPDSPSGLWTHWVIYNIPADVKSIQQELQNLPAGSVELNNSWLHAKYDGPCPPSGI